MLPDARERLLRRRRGDVLLGLTAGQANVRPLIPNSRSLENSPPLGRTDLRIGLSLFCWCNRIYGQVMVTVLLMDCPAALYAWIW